MVAWSADLDARPGSGAGSGSSGAQAPALLFLRRLAQSRAEWGILTNGRRWRLYARGAEPLEAAYEVDLAALAARAAAGAVDPLRAYWLFFAASAQVEPAAGEPSFLAAARRESREYAARIEDDLRVRAFDAIQAACQALADALAAERAVSTAFLSREDLSEVYADALALLYRLLFILYAESRDLLPVHDPAYAAHYSLRELIARLPARPDAAVDALDDAEAAAIWPRLARLFRALSGEQGGERGADPVPAFSGRLFDAALHPCWRG